MKKTFSVLAIVLLLTPALHAQKLLAAVEAKNYADVEQAIKVGENVNTPRGDGQFPLWNAIWNHDTKMVDLLLKNGANAKQKFKGETEATLLEVAAQEGLLDIIKLLVASGADADERSTHGQTPLRTAARNGRTDLVKYFLSKGCEVNTKADDGATPLEAAAGKGHMDIVKLLVEKGADVNLQDKEGDCALGEAARSGHMEVVKYLLSKGANPSLKNMEGQNAAEIARLAGQAKIETFLKEKANAKK